MVSKMRLLDPKSSTLNFCDKSKGHAGAHQILLYYFLKLETDYAIIVSGFLDPFLTIYLLT